MSTNPAELWQFLPVGYALTVLLETPVLLAGLSRRHPVSRRLFAGWWLTAGTYPIVVLVLPPIIDWLLGPESYWPYLAVAETFAPVAECAMFWAAFWTGSPSAEAMPPRNEHRRDFGQDMAAIVAANLCSFLVGGWLVQALGL